MINSVIQSQKKNRGIVAVVLFQFVFLFSVNAQSLIANGGFEDINICTEFHAKCAPEAWFKIPATEVSINNVIPARSGKKTAAVVVANKNNPEGYRVYLYTMLLCTLEKDVSYKISFYLNPIYEKQFDLGILFSEKELISGIDDPLSFLPQKRIRLADAVDYNKKTKWYKIETVYTAKGGEMFMVFGNFQKEAFIFDKKTVFNNTLGDLVYLIDDVSVKPLNEAVFRPCSEYDKNMEILYEVDHRHSNKKGVLKLNESNINSGGIDSGNE